MNSIAPSLTILAIDDTQDNLTILKALLADAFPGVRTFTALSGQQGLDLALAEDPDVILLDIVMPGMDGFAVCRKLKGDERLRYTPVIFLTAARTDSQSRVKALEAGAEAFLTKPIEAAELTAQIRAMARIKTANLGERREKERLEALVAERTGELEQELAERKRAEQEKEALQAELAHAQRMESIGRLAGGVAHDFNNLLTVINGYSALVADRMQKEDPSRPALEQINRAGERAATLVRQLLAFSRKQVLEPEVLDLNAVIRDIETMLERLVGDDVEVVVRPAPFLGSVLADRQQLEQAILNLAANARDAMSGGGRLTLETGERRLLGTCPICEHKIVPGVYVELIVRDTGEGMDEPTRLRLFEPFFTTKGVGQGTGLGLSAVHGIVVQSGGHVGVESESGKGAAFHIHLPLVARPPDRIEPRPAAAVAQGAETVLVVEDRAEVREFAAAVLESYGYRALRAEGGEQALAICAARPVDLLLTDVMMPKMNGVELARRARFARPELKTLFMSGYSEEIHERRGEDLAGAPFVQKPFSPQALAEKVRAALGVPPRAARLLVVDDEQDVRRYLRQVLEESGYEVTEASDGRQAMKCLGAGRIDLVITDLVMPGQEGIETIQAIRTDYPQLGIIAISGASGGAYLQLAKRLGADAALLKPLTAGLLLAEVEKGLLARR